MVNFLGYDAQVRKQQYPADGSIALQLWCQNGPLAKATVNLSHFGLTPPEGCAYIKNYAENEGILQSLVKGKVVEPIEEIQPGIYLVKVLI